MRCIAGSTAFATAAGKDFNGNDLAISPLTATTPAQCASLCSVTAGCSAFTYNPYVQRTQRAYATCSLLLPVWHHVQYWTTAWAVKCIACQAVQLCTAFCSLQYLPSHGRAVYAVAALYLQVIGMTNCHGYPAGCNVKVQGDSTTVVTLPATESLVVAGTAYVAPCSEAYPRLDFTVTDVFGDAVRPQTSQSPESCSPSCACM